MLYSCPYSLFSTVVKVTPLKCKSVCISSLLKTSNGVPPHSERNPKFFQWPKAVHEPSWHQSDIGALPCIHLSPWTCQTHSIFPYAFSSVWNILSYNTYVTMSSLSTGLSVPTGCCWQLSQPPYNKYLSRHIPSHCFIFLPYIYHYIA